MDNRISPAQRALAKKHGYTDAEIDQYLTNRNSGVGFEPPARGAPPSGTPAAEAQIDRTQGAPFGDRLAASFKSNPQDRLNYFKKSFGDENVMVSPGGETLFKNPKTMKWTSIDEQGFSLGDLADFAGDIPELAGMALSGGGSGIVKGLAKAGAGAGAGNILKQLIGGLLPGRGSQSGLERGGEVAGAAALGVSGEGVGRAVGAVADAPIKSAKDAVTRWVANRVMKTAKPGFESDFAQESMRLQKEHGIPLTASQTTQGPFEKTLAGYAARSPFGVPAFEKFETSQQRASMEAAQRLLDKLGPQMSEEGVGENVAAALHGHLLSLREHQQKQSARDFGFLDMALGGQPSIPTNNLYKYLMEQADRFSAPDMPASKEVASALREYIQGIPNGQLSARSIEERLKQYGAQTYGKDGPSMFKNMDRELETRMKRQMYQALRKDVSDMADSPSPLLAAQPARLLKMARDNYEQATLPIEAVQDSTLGRFMYSPSAGSRGTENIAQWFTKGNRAPSEVRNAVAMLSKTNPEVMDQVTRYMVENAMKAGREGGQGTLAGFDRASMLKTLPNTEILQALGKPDIAQNIGGLGELLSRSLWQGGQRPVLQESPMKTASSVASQDTMFGKGKLLLERVLTPKMIANFETDAQARADLFATLEAAQKTQQTIPQQSSMSRVLRKAVPLSIYEGELATDPMNDPNRGPLPYYGN